MAWRSGYKGTVYVGANKVLEVTGASISEQADDIVAASVDSAHKRHDAGPLDTTGVIRVLFDDADATGQGTLVPGDRVVLNLRPVGSTTGDLLLTSAGNDDDGKVVILARGTEIPMDGAITREYTWAGQLVEDTVA